MAAKRRPKRKKYNTLKGRHRLAKRRNAPKWRVRKRVAKALKKYVQGRKNPSSVKGRKVKGGRAVTLKNFTGTVVRKANGQVQIVGKGRKR